jgi:GUN4-like
MSHPFTKEGDCFTEEKLVSFPCTDLKTIDGLWTKYSRGQFRFSVQKQIHDALDARHSNSGWEEFGDLVGWRKGDNMTPNFTTMLISDLRAYVLSHREDTAAFQTLIDRLKSNGSGTRYPCPNTPETIALTQKAIREKLGR